MARSFAQFQIDRNAVHRDSRTLRLEQQLEQARRSADCDQGDVAAWLAAGRAGRTADDDELGALRPGSVIDSHGGAIVLSVAHRSGGVVVRAATAAGDIVSIRAGQLRSPVPELGEVRLPQGYGPTSPEMVPWVIEELAGSWSFDAHGVAGCPDLDRHLEALREVDAIEARLSRGRSLAAQRVGRLERRFDAVADILHQTGFAEAWELTAAGQLLTDVHGECEVVLAEALAEGTLENLQAPGFAAVISCLAYEARGRDVISPRWPSKPVRLAVNHLRARARRYRTMELDSVDECLTREPDPGLVEVVHGWATGRPLDEVLPEAMSGGEFVRSIRQVIDLCRQISQSGATVATIASEAIHCLDHGVVRNRDLFVDLDEPGPGDFDSSDERDRDGD